MDMAPIISTVQDIMKGSSSPLLSAAIIYAARRISKAYSDSKKDCAWHKEQTITQNFALDAVLDYIQRDAVRHDIELNGRFARARKHIDDNMEKIEKGVN